jgi:hypothetical protein
MRINHITGQINFLCIDLVYGDGVYQQQDRDEGYDFFHFL